MSEVTRESLAAGLTEKLGLSRAESLDTVNEVFERISQLAASGESVRVTGVGVFSMRHKAERPGRNPKTGEPKTIAARDVLVCKFSPKYKENIKNGN